MPAVLGEQNTEQALGGDADIAVPLVHGVFTCGPCAHSPSGIFIATLQKRKWMLGKVGKLGSENYSLVCLYSELPGESKGNGATQGEYPQIARWEPALGFLPWRSMPLGMAKETTVGDRERCSDAHCTECLSEYLSWSSNYDLPASAS